MEIKRRISLWLGVKTGLNPYRLEPFGKCPVQIEGRLKNGMYYYFRARHEGVSFGIADTEDKAVFNSGKFNRFCEHQFAGWIDNEDAIRLATVWINEYSNLREFQNDKA